MKRWRIPVLLVSAVIGGLFVTGVQSGEDKEQQKMMPFGTQHDVQMARLLWNAIEGYQNNWAEYPGLEGWQPGNSPHGNWLKYYINNTAKSNLKSLPYGSIIVKENYMKKNVDKKGPVTVMARIKGYDADNYDWFYVKYSPDGSIDTNPKGIKLTGAVAKGMDTGCISCHAGAEGDDFVFANDDDY